MSCAEAPGCHVAACTLLLPTAGPGATLHTIRLRTAVVIRSDGTICTEAAWVHWHVCGGRNAMHAHQAPARLARQALAALIIIEVHH